MAYQNFYATKLSAGISDSVTSFDVDTPPTATTGRLVLEPRNPATREIIKYTGVAGTTLTGVTRGVGGTTATAHNASVLVEMNLTADDIQDIYDAFNTFSGTTDWHTIASAVSSVTYNGQRSYDIVYNGVDLTSSLSPGKRLRTTRTVAAPTQSTLLDGTAQFYTKTTPNKMTFTDDFVVSAWIKLTSYGSTSMSIASRFNGTSGWDFQIQGTGQVLLAGYNGGAANNSYVTSSQSIPLGKWVHVVAQLDMSAFTATSTTSYVMIDEVFVPVSLVRGGTNPTTLAQAGNLEIGSRNGGTQLFAGNIAQVAIFNAKVTQATMQGYVSQGLAGTETSLASAYSFNNSINDLNTTTPNNLTASGSAVATNADSPFGGQGSGLISSTLDYAIVQKVAFSTNTTVTVQVAGGCTIPTSGGVSATSHSSERSPYNFPSQEGRWSIESVYYAALAYSIGSINQFNQSAARVTAPVGRWNIEAQGCVTIYSTVSGTRSGFLVISPTTPPNIVGNIIAPGYRATRLVSFAATAAYVTMNIDFDINATTATTYSLWVAIDVATGSESYDVRGDFGGYVFTLRNAYL